MNRDLAKLAKIKRLADESPVEGERAAAKAVYETLKTKLELTDEQVESCRRKTEAEEARLKELKRARVRPRVVIFFPAYTYPCWSTTGTNTSLNTVW